MKYRIEAHWRNGEEFQRSIEALSCQHAGAIFVIDMKKEGHIVGTVSYDGTHSPFLACCETGPVDVVIDRIRRIC